MEDALKALQLAGSIVQLGAPLAEQLVQAIVAYRQSVSAEAAEAKFQAMLALLADPHGDAARTNAEVDAAIARRFGPA